MDISISVSLLAWAESQVSNGHYDSVEAYVGDLINRDRLSLLDHGALVAALAAGEASGVHVAGEPLSPDAGG